MKLVRNVYVTRMWQMRSKSVTNSFVRIIHTYEKYEVWILRFNKAIFMRTTKTLIRPGGCPGWSESSLGTHSFCWFCHVVAQFFLSFAPFWYGCRNTFNSQNSRLSIFDMVVLNIFNSEINAFQVHAMTYVSLYPFSQSY